MMDKGEAANWVLGYFWNPTYEFYAPGNFYCKLLEAMIAADEDNLRMFRPMWPELYEAVNIYKNSQGGVEILRRRARDWQKKVRNHA